MWKVFAVLTCLLTAGSFIWLALVVSGQTAGDFNLMDLISMVISVPATIGLVCYAYGKAILPSGFWPPFAKVLTFWTALYLVDTTWRVLSHDMANSAWSELAGLVVLHGIFGVFAYFGWLGVWRYAHRVKQQAVATS